MWLLQGGCCVADFADVNARNMVDRIVQRCSSVKVIQRSGKHLKMTVC